MKNNFIIIIYLFFLSAAAHAENLLIKSKNITLDKNKEISVFEKEVFIKTEENNTITSDYAEYNQKKEFLILKNNITAVDNENNIIESDYAEYDEKAKIFISKGKTKIITSEQYIIESEDVIFNNNLNFISSDNKTTIIDRDQNIILLDNFEYQTKNNIFKSLGFIKVEDKMGNTSEFSQVYIDTKKREILGTDIKAFMNHPDFKSDVKNKPRIFANTVKIDDQKKSFRKSIYTLCDYRKNDKCPPWSIQASKMLHDNKKKTIYYENAVVKVYDIPIFYFPKLSHPDPSVDRRSGFLPPSFSDSKNLGSGLSVPYFWAINNHKDVTFTNKIFTNENPLFSGEYRHAFKNSDLIFDTGYTKGYQKTSVTKKSGDKSHFFSEFVKNFYGKNNSENNLSIKTQHVSNDKYLKLYRIKSSLADYNQDTLENSLNFTHENEDYFLGFNTSVYETLKSEHNDKYEYILPDVTIDRNLFTNNSLGNLDLQSNLKIHNYDTNKTEKLLVNDFDWSLRNFNFVNGVQGSLKSKIKNVNYESENIDRLKEDANSELFGAVGYLTKVNLFKKFNNARKDMFTPKILVRYAPGKMRKGTTGSRLNNDNIFSLDRLNNNDNFENGLSATVGFDYEIEASDKELNFSLGQIINEKENKNMPSVTSLDEKLSDAVGTANLTIKDKVKLDYSFSLDQNYKDLNYNEIGSSINLNPVNIDFSYLQEKKHVGNQEYFKAKVDLNKSSNGVLSLETKRNLVTNSSEYYNLSYEYLNDCLRAGLVFRREFYNDSELESENSLMFKITLVPFSNISSPSFNK